MLKPQPPAMPMAVNDSNAIFHEALALLDEFYTIDGIDLVPEPWYGKLEPVPLPPQQLPVHGVAANFPSAPRSTSSEHSDHHESDDIASADTQSTAGNGASQPRRNRQREELLRLREEAVELEKQMNDLRQRRQTAAAVAESMSQEERDMMALWEKIAVRQQSERQRVEIENAKLKELFAAQTRVAQELRRLLEKQMKANATVPSLANGASVPRRRCQLHEMPGVHIFEHLIGELEKLYAQTDSALAMSGVNAVEPPFRTTQLKLDDHAGVRVELIGRRIVPFDVHDMSKAIWSQAHEGAMHPYYYFYDEAESPEELIIRHCGIRAPHGDTSVDLIGKHCSRRFVEQDRVVVAWCAMLEPQVYSGVPANDLRFRENGWVVLTRANAPGATEVRMFRVISPDVPPGGEATADWRIYALIDFVSNVIHSQGTLMQQRVENALLENSLKRQMSGDSRAQETPRGKMVA